VTIRESEILKSKWEEVGFPKIYGKESIVLVFPKIARVNVVKAEPEVSTVLLVEVDATWVSSPSEDLD
jgi:hypothetical protein